MKVILLENKVSVVELPLKDAIRVMSPKEFIKSLPVFGQDESLSSLGRIGKLE